MDLLSQRIAVDRAIVQKGSFYDFFRMAWSLIDPAPLVLNWHLEEKCNHLQAVSNGEIRRLIINEPPGSGKSNTVNVLWNVWEWVLRPQTKFIYASFDASLVGTRDGGKVIRLLGSEWFKLRWGNILQPGKQAASMFETTAGGFRFSTSPGGKGLGRHADIRAVDDPLKPGNAREGVHITGVMLRAVLDWWADTMSSRATDQTTVRDVLTMQRLHEIDLAGDWLLKGDCVHLCFPMVYEPDRACRTRWGGDRRSIPGDLLFPQRFPQDVVDRMRTTEMGEDVFAAQCQQRPVRKGGTLFKRSWWSFYDVQDGVPQPCLCDECWAARRTLAGHEQVTQCVVLPRSGLEVQSWDCTFKKKTDSDFVSGGVFRLDQNRVFLLDRVNERMGFTDTVQALRHMSQKWPRALDKLVEDKANGSAVEDTLKSEIPGITLVNPEGGKESRANAGSIFFSSRRFFVPHPRLAPWVWAYMIQHELFPKGPNDDDVDMTSQVLVRYRKFGEHFAAAMAKLRGEQ